MLGMVTEVFWQGLLKKVPKRLCVHSSFISVRMHEQTVRQCHRMQRSLPCVKAVQCELHVCSDMRHLECLTMPMLL